MAVGSAVKREVGGGLRVLFSLASVVIIVAGLKAAAALFVPMMLGIFLALLSLPILNWLVAQHFPRLLAVVATVLIDLFFLFVVVFLLSGIAGDLQSKSAEYAERMKAQAGTFSETMDRQLERFSSFWSRAGVDFTPEERPKREERAEDDSPTVIGPRPDPGVGKMSETILPPLVDVLDASIPTFQELFERYWDSNRVVAVIGQFDVVARFTAFASQSIFALIVMIFLLTETHVYAQKVKDVLREKGPDLSQFQRTSADIQKYLAIKSVASAVTGLLAGLSCLFFRVDFPLLWGLVAFVFNYVPAIGSIVAAIPPVILALILHGFWPAFGLLACYLVINFLIGNFLEPIFMGERFGLSTVIVIFSVLFWGFIWGPVGMLLSVPLTMIVKVMLDNSPEFRWISALIGKSRNDSDESESGADSEVVHEPTPLA